MRTVPLGGKKAAGRVAVVDDEDYDLVMQYRWWAWERAQGERRPYGPYAQGGPAGHRVYMHTLITGYARTDHVNHNGLDNRRSNLRDASVAQNNHNQRPRRTGSSSYKGVTWHRGAHKWQASIKVDGRTTYLGLFASEKDAALAYDQAALRAYGEYAFINLGGAA